MPDSTIRNRLIEVYISAEEQQARDLVAGWVAGFQGSAAAANAYIHARDVGEICSIDAVDAPGVNLAVNSIATINAPAYEPQEGCTYDLWVSDDNFATYTVEEYNFGPEASVVRPFAVGRKWRIAIMQEGQYPIVGPVNVDPT